MTTLTGLDHCLAGTIEHIQLEPTACYYKHKIITALQADGASTEEALDFIDYNILGLYTQNPPAVLSIASVAPVGFTDATTIPLKALISALANQKYPPSPEELTLYRNAINILTT